MKGLVNFFAPSERIGTAGQPSTNQLAEIAAAGYTAVVNLAMPDSDNAIAAEGSIVASHGMSYFHIPVPFERPSPRHLRQFFGVMDALADEKVFVHCAVNARVSAFMYQYLTLVHRVSPDQATSPLLERWRSRMDPPWAAIMALTLDDIMRS